MIIIRITQKERVSRWNRSLSELVTVIKRADIYNQKGNPRTFFFLFSKEEGKSKELLLLLGWGGSSDPGPLSRPSYACNHDPQQVLLDRSKKKKKKKNGVKTFPSRKKKRKENVSFREILLHFVYSGGTRF